ncbi:hypothetical protein CPB83DRAFT_423335 [Crepidotus variabilis]|uniref:F-box domain-containing protein n=1 Tax=Crepidotus variabilis TaxID=179855 RepID=A0A9P6JP11_9AGAR|nr:hypothetical protein CPB83DRAFT_423335 [Crepidotus variabilis]
MGHTSPQILSKVLRTPTSSPLHKIMFDAGSNESAPLNPCTLPEEILEEILSYIVPTSLSHNSRPTWHQQSDTSNLVATKSSGMRTRQAVLLVCKTFYRVALPLFYHTVHLHHPHQAKALFEKALLPKPEIASHIRRLVLAGAWAECGEIMKACAMVGNGLRVLDFTLNFDVGPHRSGNRISARNSEKDAQIFSEGLKRLRAVTQLTVRKPDSTYLSQKGVRGVIEGLAHAVERWDELEYVDCAFRLSDDTPGSLPSLRAHVPSIYLPPPPPQTTSTSRFSPPSAIFDASPTAQLQPSIPRSGRLPLMTHGKPTTPNALLIHSLRSRPRLRTFCTRLPNIWNECILRVSENPNLERIVLADPMNQPNFHAKDLYAAPVGACYPDAISSSNISQGHGHGQVFLGPGPSSLFMMQARKYPKLCELIRAGTFIMRPRAQTLATSTPPSTPPPTTATKTFAESQMSLSMPPTSSQAAAQLSPPSPVKFSHSHEGTSQANSTVTPSPPSPIPSMSPRPSSRTGNRHSYHHQTQFSPTRPHFNAWQFYPSMAVSSPVRPSSQKGFVDVVTSSSLGART